MQTLAHKRRYRTRRIVVGGPPEPDIFVQDDSCRFSVPDTKVSVLHQIDIVWPDGTGERVSYAEDVTPIFKDPRNAGRHIYLANALLASRVNTRLDFGRRQPRADTSEPTSVARGWLARMFR